MNTKKPAVASICVFIAFQIMDFIIHGIVLSADYQLLGYLWRPDMMSKMWIMALSSLVMSVLFVYIFLKGYENKGIMEGVRFGIVAGLFMNVAGVFSQYAIYPIPFGLALKWFFYCMMEFMVAGIVVSLVYRPRKNKKQVPS